MIRRRFEKQTNAGKPGAFTDATPGFTLIEVIVGAVLVSLSVIAVVSVVNTGSALERSNNDRRAARALIRSVFEQDYDLRDYNTVSGDTTFNDSVVIEERQTNSLNGNVKTRIVAENIANGAVEVQGKAVSINCGWTAENGARDSVALTKIYARAK
jgi:type II secretory pathway pseudopilin PulG